MAGGGPHIYAGNMTASPDDPIEEARARAAVAREEAQWLANCSHEAVRMSRLLLGRPPLRPSAETPTGPDLPR